MGLSLSLFLPHQKCSLSSKWSLKAVVVTSRDIVSKFLCRHFVPFLRERVCFNTTYVESWIVSSLHGCVFSILQTSSFHLVFSLGCFTDLTSRSTVFLSHVHYAGYSGELPPLNYFLLIPSLLSFSGGLRTSVVYGLKLPFILTPFL